jgi:beta-lactamase regulating signal transducer with metallopeptidase domain
VTGLAAWIWQALVLVGATSLLLRLFPRVTAATRHVVWWIALATVLVRPWTWLVPFQAMAGPAPAGGLVAAPLLLPSPPAWLVAALAIVWLVVFAWRAWRIGMSVRVVATLKRDASPFDALRAQRLPVSRALAESPRRCALRVTDRSAGACALGFVRPVILIPRALAARLSDRELDQVIAHEHAHLLRYDDWLRLLQCCIDAVLGLHPAIWLIGRQLDLEREAACDDYVVARTGAARAYADCLARVAALLVARRRDAVDFAPAVTRSGALLRLRVTRLLDRERNRTPRVGRLTAVAYIVALGVLVTACDQLPPLVAFANAGALVRAAVLPVSHVPRVEQQPKSDVARTTHGGRRVVSTRAPRPLASPVLTVAAATPVDAGVPDAIGAPLTWTPPPVASHVQLPAVRLSPVAQSPVAPANPKDPSWSDAAIQISRAGRGAGKSAQHFGQAVGGWFAKAPWIGKGPEQH